MLGGVARLGVYPVFRQKKRKKRASSQPPPSLNSLAPIINFHRTDGGLSQRQQEQRRKEGRKIQDTGAKAAQEDVSEISRRQSYNVLTDYVWQTEVLGQSCLKLIACCTDSLSHPAKLLLKADMAERINERFHLKLCSHETRWKPLSSSTSETRNFNCCVWRRWWLVNLELRWIWLLFLLKLIL